MNNLNHLTIVEKTKYMMSNGKFYHFKGSDRLICVSGRLSLTLSFLFIQVSRAKN